MVSGDIERFVGHELQIIFKKYKLPLPAVTDIKRLVKKSGALFIYAATALRFIGDENVKNPQKQLAIIFDSRHDLNANPYHVLDTLYRQVLKKSIPQNKSIRKQIEKWNCDVVSVIVMLREPLPLVALARFVGMETAETKNALDSLQSVIHVPSSSKAANKAPRIFHPSFIDFIKDKKRCTDKLFWVDGPVKETFLAKRCLKIMKQSLKRDMAGIKDGTVMNADVANLKGRVKKEIPNELRYACLHWASHITAARDVGRECVSSLDEFTRRSLLSWMEAMSLLGEIRRAILMLRDMRAWAVSVHWLHYAMIDSN